VIERALETSDQRDAFQTRHDTARVRPQLVQLARASSAKQAFAQAGIAAGAREERVRGRVFFKPESAASSCNRLDARHDDTCAHGGTNRRHTAHSSPLESTRDRIHRVPTSHARAPGVVPRRPRIGSLGSDHSLYNLLGRRRRSRISPKPASPLAPEWNASAEGFLQPEKCSFWLRPPRCPSRRHVCPRGHESPSLRGLVAVAITRDRIHRVPRSHARAPGVVPRRPRIGSRRTAAQMR
jgi:hypothetical protein